tara:strand:+ start:200 stop:484 length:285 start_codon:yes stop_codon:yes gene_type:complete
MKKLLGIVVLILLWCGNAYADPENPTNLWLDTQTVNSLTQEHGYQLVHTAGVSSRVSGAVIWTLTKPKSNINDGKFIVVTCSSRGEDITDCWLP